MARSPCRQVDDFERDVVQQLLQIVRKIDRRTPEDLAIIFGRGQFVGIMGRDFSHARAYRKSHLDQIVERRLIARGAERAIILRPIQRLQAFVGGKNPGAARAHHVPCHLEHAEPHRIQERCDDPLFVDALRACEIKRVHLVQGMIRGIPHHTLEHVDNGFVGRLTQGRKQSLGFTHATMLPERRQREHPLTHNVRVVVALAGRPARVAIGGACHSRQKARDEIAGFLLKRRWRCRSADGATGGRGWRGRLGRPCRPRCQDAQLMRSGRGGQRRRLLPDISGAQHANLHRRYRQPLRFIARQLRCKTGSGTRNRD